MFCRIVECHSEDPFLAAELGVRQMLGIKASRAASTLKHYAVCLVPKGGRVGVRSSCNDYDGIPVTGNKLLLTDILRREWVFKGYVISDSKAVDTVDAVRQLVPEGKLRPATIDSRVRDIRPLKFWQG